MSQKDTGNAPTTAKRKWQRPWTPEQLETVKRMLAENQSRRALGKYLGLDHNSVGLACRLHGLGAEYEKTMKARRGGHISEIAAREVSDDANRMASQKLASALAKAKITEASREPRAPLTFEQQLELVRTGKARVVPNIKADRSATYAPSLLGGSMT